MQNVRWPIASALLAIIAIANAQTFPPKPTGTYVSDQAHLLTSTDRQRIQADSKRLLNKIGAPIVVATIPSLQAEHAANLSIGQYARKLFDHWHIGSQDQNLGILLLVSKGDRKAKFEMGESWNGSLNGQADNAMNGILIPNFKRKAFSAGIADSVETLANQAVRTNSQNERAQINAPDPYIPSEPQGSGLIEVAALFFPIVFIAVPCIFGVIFLLILVRLITTLGRRGGVSNQRRGNNQPGTMFNQPPDPYQPMPGQGIDPNIVAVTAWEMSQQQQNTMPDPTPSPSFDPTPAPTYNPDPSPPPSTGFDGGSGGGGGSTGSW